MLNAARTLDHTARLSGDLPRLVERVQTSADGFDRMTGELARAGADANATLAGTRADLREAADEIVPEARLLVAELRELTGSLKRYSQELERNPSMLLFGRPAPQPGPGEQAQ